MAKKPVLLCIMDGFGWVPEQTDGNAIVVQNLDELAGIDLDRDILLYSQTTKSIDGFSRIVE